MQTPDSDNPEVAPPPPLPATPPEQADPAGIPMKKNALFAGFLSVFPGAGHIYNGLYLRGVTFFVVAASAIYMATHRGELWGFVIAFVWIFNVLDAWRQANLINYGYTTDLGLNDPPRAVGQGAGGIIGGAALLLVGLVAAMEMYLELDIDWMLDLWPVVLMVLGAWFIWSSIQTKRETDEAAEAESSGL